MRAILKLVFGLSLTMPIAAVAHAQQVCEAIAGQARRFTPAADGAFLFPVQGLDQMQGSVVRLGQAQRQEMSKLIDVLRTTFLPTAELLKAAQDLASSSDYYGTLWEVGRGLHAFEVEGGTAHCSSFVFFTSEPDGPATLVDLPPAARGKDGEMRLCSGVGSEGLVGTVKGEPAFFLQEGKDQDFEIGVTLWKERAWQPECKLSLHFNAAFSIDQRFCSGVDCEAAANAGLALAKRFDKGLPDQEEAKLGAQEREAFRAMVSHRPEGLPPFASKEFPTFGSKSQPHDFGCDDILLPVKLAGRLYVGRLGHGSIGWRCFNDFVFALYAPKDGEFEPVAGITIGKVRAAPVEAVVVK